MKKNIEIGIIGAGIQGISNALFLQKKGFQVTLFDRDEPGNAASYGNAGIFLHTHLSHLIEQTF